MVFGGLLCCCQSPGVLADVSEERVDVVGVEAAPSANAESDDATSLGTSEECGSESQEDAACHRDDAEEASIDSASTGSGDAEPTTATPPEDGEVENLPGLELARPNYAGNWLLAETEGDFEAWLLEMKQPFYVRAAAKAMRYGVGKVRVRCEQSGDTFFFAKTLADPRRFRDVTVRFTVGVDRKVPFFDDIGAVTIQTSKWEGSHLVMDAIADDTKLPLQLRIYFDARGNFVEEMVSCGGKSIVYTFHAR